MTDLQEGLCTLLGRDIFGEASANYLLGCALSIKVARGVPLENIFLGNKWTGDLVCLLPPGASPQAKDKIWLASWNEKALFLDVR
jgi:hypothetical protein